MCEQLRQYVHYVSVWIRQIRRLRFPLLHFPFLFFIFYCTRNGRQRLLFMYCACTVPEILTFQPFSAHQWVPWNPQTSLFSKFLIKNGSHDTIHTFKNYFATVFSVSAKISSIQTDLYMHFHMCVQQNPILKCLFSSTHTIYFAHLFTTSHKCSDISVNTTLIVCALHEWKIFFLIFLFFTRWNFTPA